MTESPSFMSKDSKGRAVRVVEITCEQCGKDAVVRACGTGRFCSKSCAATWRHSHGQWPEPQRGADHVGWKGADATYIAMHMRVRRSRGPADHCEQRATAGCTSTKYNWAWIHNADPSDPQSYWQLCRQCHVAYDGNIGSTHVRSKLTDEQVAEIRRRYAAGGVSYRELGEQYGVHLASIAKIVLGRTYRTGDS